MRHILRNGQKLASFSLIPPARNWIWHIPSPRRWSSKLSALSASIQTAEWKQNQPVLSDAQRKTIYALSTPPGKAGVGIIRVSGPDALRVWSAVLRTSIGSGLAAPTPWKMQRCRVVHPERQDEVLDDGMAIFFRAPKSFTTEDVLELHIHSGRAIVSAVLKALSSLPSCRPAEPGEFTRRAFQGGRLDLTQVEGLKDLIDAETESQRAVALRAARGEVHNRFEHLRKDIIHCLAMVEALIDFGEGEDIEEGVFAQAREEAIKLNDTIKSYLSDNRRGEIIRSGIRLAIFGPPNAGKSSLLNFLVQREAAIVTSIPGTTRDILEVSLDIGGLPVIVADTAGLRQTEDVVESIGIERARNRVQGSDISLCVLSLPELLNQQTPELSSSVKSLVTPNTYFLLNKADLLLGPMEERRMKEALMMIPNKSWIVSLTSGEGTSHFLSEFGDSLQEHFKLQGDLGSAVPLITHARHRAHLETANRFIEAFLQYGAEDVVLGAEELRYAAQAVGKITGAIDVEDVLDAVFKDFCIGK
ncbi:trna modification gtpase mitochondrial-like [Moniliophthora roreri MCA 2997]|uniref:Trna modification gtpase mitochondrial-like n=2 Tax=Moniliophthora roreri TaxID=221103 RepID=V2XIK4_MONRO|nr:trna modification gtpase mitochondrial-like [Moniliophthora roreri MCA 2997]KAI3612909.1 trna modification gtpase mitochondrial-like [Moniliophthora roreri]